MKLIYGVRHESSGILCECFDLDIDNKVDSRVGYIKLTINEETKHIDIEDNLVNETHRRRGIATQLYTTALDHLFKQEKYSDYTIGGHPTSDAKKLLIRLLVPQIREDINLLNLDNVHTTKENTLIVI